MTDPPGDLNRLAAVRAGFAGRVRGLRQAARSADPAVRAAAIGGLHRSGHCTVEDLAEGAADADAAVRRRTGSVIAASAGSLDSTELAVLARRLVEDDDASVVETGCFAAGELDRAPAELVDALVRVASHHDDPLCRESAVAALGSIGDPSGWPGVESGCRDVATIRRRAVLALVAFDNPRAGSLLQELAADHDWQVRQAAEELLAR